jgi:hypothetical protein
VSEDASTYFFSGQQTSGCVFQKPGVIEIAKKTSHGISSDSDHTADTATLEIPYEPLSDVHLPEGSCTLLHSQTYDTFCFNGIWAVLGRCNGLGHFEKEVSVRLRFTEKSYNLLVEVSERAENMVLV